MPEPTGTAMPGPEELEREEIEGSAEVVFELYGPANHRVALTIPRLLGVEVGQTVSFTHESKGEVTLMFPRPFFDEGQYFPMEAGKTTISLTVRTDLPLGDRGRLIPYQAYFAEENVFAIGGSPPKMIVDPPPPTRGP